MGQNGWGAFIDLISSGGFIGASAPCVFIVEVPQGKFQVVWNNHAQHKCLLQQNSAAEIVVFVIHNWADSRCCIVTPNGMRFQPADCRRASFPDVHVPNAAQFDFVMILLERLEDVSRDD